MTDTKNEELHRQGGRLSRRKTEAAKALKTEAPRILTHVHLYYTDMWPEIKQSLANITIEYDLIVTLVEENLSLQKDILSFHPQAKIKIVENRGFDVAAFVDILNQTDLNSYDYIIKLHSKRDMPVGTVVGKYDVSGAKWRRYCLNFLRNKAVFQTCLKAFEQNEKLGMIGNFRLICKKDKASTDAVVVALDKLQDLGFVSKEYSYVMGTMFFVRAKLFEPIKRLALTMNDFGASVRGEEVLPYAMERLFGYIIGAQGYQVKDVTFGRSYQFLAPICKCFCRFIWRKKVCADGKVVIKFCKIPCYKGIAADFCKDKGLADEVAVKGPEISVIIPCYNQEKYIAEAIESVLDQTFQNIEMIVVNDGSSDSSLSIIKDYASKYPDKVRYIDQKNKGVIVARNNAIVQATGKYVFPLDGDDKIAPDCLEKLYNAMKSNKGDVIYCGGEYFDGKTGRINHPAPTKFNMCIENRVCVSALYRKEDWARYGGYDEIMKQGWEDWEFWLNFVKDNKRFYKVDKPLFFYRILDASRNSEISKSLEKELMCIMKHKHKDLFGWKFQVCIFLSKISSFFYRKKVTKSGKLSIKICKIPLPVSLMQLLSGEK